jgi:hypothetical protein
MSVHPGSEWIDVNWNALMQSYVKWVAASKDGFVTEAASYPELMYKLDNLRVELSKVAIACIDPNVIQ